MEITDRAAEHDRRSRGHRHVSAAKALLQGGVYTGPDRRRAEQLYRGVTRSLVSEPKSEAARIRRQLPSTFSRLRNFRKNALMSRRKRGVPLIRLRHGQARETRAAALACILLRTRPWSPPAHLPPKSKPRRENT